jgi:hypothetical protein
MKGGVPLDKLIKPDGLGLITQQAAEKTGIVVVMRSDAYEIAKKDDGKYHGFYQTHRDLSEAELLKSIRSSNAQIDKHRKWIDNPSSKISDFYELDARRQKSLIEVHWPTDIQRHQRQIDIVGGILKERGL